MNLLRIFLFVIITKIFHNPFVKSESRNRKINFFTTSALLNCIIWINQKFLFVRALILYKLIQKVNPDEN